MRLFQLNRIKDETGISGTGVVAQGVIFDNGWCSLVWLTDHTSMAFYTSIDEVIAIHGHNGRTEVVQIADCDAKKVEGLCTNAAQDVMENAAVSLGGPDTSAKRLGNYLWSEREQFCDLFRHEVLK